MTDLETVRLDELISEVSPVVSECFGATLNAIEIHVEGNASEHIESRDRLIHLKSGKEGEAYVVFEMISWISMTPSPSSMSWVNLLTQCSMTSRIKGPIAFTASWLLTSC